MPAANIFLTFLDAKTRDLLKTDERVEYKQANIGRDDACEAAFETPAGKAYDWIFDVSGDAGMAADSHEVHCQLVSKFAAHLARAALRNGGVKAYVRVLLPAFAAKKGSAGTVRRCRCDRADSAADPRGRPGRDAVVAGGDLADGSMSGSRSLSRVRRRLRSR